MQIEEALNRYLVQLEADGRSVHTIGQYRRHIVLLARWAREVRPGRDRLEDLGHEAIAQFLTSPAATSRAPGGAQKLATSMNALRSSVKSFLAHCHRANYTKTDTGHLIRRAITSAPPPKGLSPEEERRLLDVLRDATGHDGKRDHVLFTLMLRSGIRVGTAVDLCVEDVDLERGVIQIRAKGGRRDQALIAQDVAEHLGDFIGERALGALFAARDGAALTTRHVARRLRGWAKKAGIKRRVSPHALRHTLGQKLYSKTGDVLLVREVLRHRSIASTMVYVRVDEERVRRAL